MAKVFPDTKSIKTKKLNQNKQALKSANIVSYVFESLNYVQYGRYDLSYNSNCLKQISLCMIKE